MSDPTLRITEGHTFLRMVAPWIAGLLLIGVLDLMGYAAICNTFKLLLLIGSLAAPFESLIYVLLILSPNDSMLAMNGFISLTSAIVVVFLIRVSLRYHAEVKIDRFLFLAGILLVFDALLRFAITGENYFTGSVKIALSFLAVGIYCSIQCDSWDANDNLYLLAAFLLGCVVLSGLSFLNFYFFDLGYDRMRPIEGDPNYLSLYLCICVALLFLWLFERDNKGIQTIALCLTAFLFVATGLLTQSRGFIVAFVPITVYLLVQLPKQFGGRPFLVALLLLLFGLAVFAFMSGQNNLIDEVIARFTSEETAGGSGRTLIWATYLHSWFSDLGMFLFGVPQVALGNLRFEVFTGHIVAVHNLYIELLCQQGLLFAICFIAIIGRLVHLMPSITNVRHATPVMSLLLGYLFLSGALSVTLPFLFLVAWVGSSCFSEWKPSSSSSVGNFSSEVGEAEAF